MCRNIKTLYNFDPPATETEIRASAQQFVRKVSGFSKPSQKNSAAIELAVDEVVQSVHQLFSRLHTDAPVKNREEEAAKAKARSAKRFGLK